MVYVADFRPRVLTGLKVTIIPLVRSEQAKCLTDTFIVRRHNVSVTNSIKAPVGIIAAMPQEISGIIELLEKPEVVRLGSRDYHLGLLAGRKVVLVLSRIGKVAAASTVTSLLSHFRVGSVVVVGVAGAVDVRLRVGDIVVAEALFQHDMDASAVMGFKKFEVPLTGRVLFPGSPDLIGAAYIAAGLTSRSVTALEGVAVKTGIIASGDRFITSHQQLLELGSTFPENVLAVEMEGAAIAQVCYEWEVPFVVMRTISDNADHNSVISFSEFVDRHAAEISKELIKNMFGQKEL